MMKRASLYSAATCSLAALTAAFCASSVPVNDWKLSGPFGGTATAVALDPHDANILLAGGRNSLLFQTQDAGANWQLVNFPKRNLSEITSVLFDPADSSHYFVGVLAAGGGGLFESRDQGKTWSSVKDISDFGVRALAAAPAQPTRFVAGTVRGVMLSDDSGKTWTRISDPQNPEMQGISAVAVDTKDANIIYAGTSHLPWKTLDGGKTWQSIHTGMIDDSDVFSIQVNPITPNEVLASACSGIYSSSDRGEMWRKLMGIPNTSRRTHVIRKDPSNGTIYAGTTTGLFKSVNNGTTWKTMTSTQVNALALDPSRPQNMYLALEDEGVGKSDNGGEQIQLVNNGFIDRAISAVGTSGNRLVALEAQEGATTGIFTSTNHGESWVQLHATRGLEGVHLRAIAGFATQERTLVAASAHSIYKSIDSGTTWKPLLVRVIVPPPATPAKTAPTPKTSTSRPAARGNQTTARAVRPVRLKPTYRELSLSEVSGLYSLKNGSKETLFAATDLGLLESANFGDHWKFAEMPGANAVTALYSGPGENGYLMAKAAGGLYLSKDFGEHWEPVVFPVPSSDVNDVAMPAQLNQPILAATRVGLYSSGDAGQQWSLNSGGLPASTVTSVIYSGTEATGYAVQYGQLYQTKDGGHSWSQLSTAFPSLRIRQLWIPDPNLNRLYAITGDLGIIFRN